MLIFKHEKGGIVWDEKSAQKLKKLRIFGFVSGSESTVQQPRSIPVILTPEQVLLLVEMKEAEFVDERYDIPTIEMKERYHSKILNQWTEFEQRKKEYQAIARNMYLSKSDTIQGPIQDRLPMKPTPPPKLQSTDLEWFQVIPAQTPKSDKFLIFKHLYDQGFYITNGSKFGGDYLVYQNDPEHCHSFYIVSIVKGRISMLDLVAHARLGKQTNKMKVFCYWDEGFHSIAMDWTGWV